MSNSENMTLAEKLPQKLKSSPMGELLDEDALGEICKRALEEAFFKPRISRDGYGRETARSEPEIVAMARGLFKEALQPKIDAAVKELSESPEFRQAILDVAVALIPVSLLEGQRQGITNAAVAGSNAAVLRIQEAVRDRSLAAGWIKPVMQNEVVVP